MSLYRRLARSKKGMSTIFGALFFVILILMGFNLILYTFVQYDAYNRAITTMGLRDQQANSENLVVNQPGATPVVGGFNISVTNLGGTAVIIQRIYINNLTPVGSSECSTSGAISPCIADTTPSLNSCITGVSCYLSSGNIQIGELNHQIKVTGLTLNSQNGYKVVLASTRGRLFSFFYPWPVTPPNSGGGGGTFVTNIGPLSIYFDYQSFNYTNLSGQTQSKPAWCVPSNQPLVFWIKIANAATNSNVTLLKNTVIFPQPYSTSGSGGTYGPFYVVDKSTQNPFPLTAYSETGNPYVLPPAGANGPNGFTIVKFGATSPGGTGTNSLNTNDFWLVFIGFNYKYLGQVQGQTIPFVAMRSAAAAPCS